VLEQFLNHIQSIRAVRKEDRFLVAVSGGVDSMVLLELFVRSGLDFAVAHCNFQLRPEESKAEQDLVTRVCAKGNISIYARAFATEEFAAREGLSIQEAARKLRYAFFEEVREQYNYHWVATAHHWNDTIETVFLNLIRGTGLDGLTGIPPINGKVIRPLLFARRRDIESFAEENNVSWRTDSSNLHNDYSRNLLRNQVIPLLKEINPSLEDTMRVTVERLEGSRLLNEGLLSDLRTSICESKGRITLEKSVVLGFQAPTVVLWELVKQFGFSYRQCQKIIATSQTGKWFSSSTHRLLIDRGSYLIEKISDFDGEVVLIERGAAAVSMDDEMMTISDALMDHRFDNDPSKAFMDLEKLIFPLTWRPWREGDSFRPLGMNNNKKLSDFFIDRKVDRWTKEGATVVESAGEIIWVVGHRIADTVKITNDTRRAVLFEWSRERG
jgi:tRNA(Ile)-lysidine synthase